ncbi:hypothetical protein DNTS_010056, partial [Danionella cerebrum]
MSADSSVRVKRSSSTYFTSDHITDISSPVPTHSRTKIIFPSCKKRSKATISSSPTFKDVAPCTPGNADVGRRKGGARSRAGAGPSTLGDPLLSGSRDAGVEAQAG